MDTVARTAVLFPTKAETVRMEAAECNISFLDKCLNNLKSELWAFFKANIDPSTRNWRNALMPRVYVGGFPKIRAMYSDPKCEEPIADMVDFASWNLILHRNQLYLLVYKNDETTGASYLNAVPGLTITDPHYSGSDHFIHILGYVKPFFKDMCAIMTLQEGNKAKSLNDTQRLILCHVANPASRSTFAYACEDAFCPTVPINDPQKGIVASLANSIECIQGPPGTGKSTTIFHILHTKVPNDYKSVVTCVQNKAVDSIAEKLGTTSMPFVVLGNPEKLGESAKRFTLEEQTLRDDEVKQITKRIDQARAIENRLMDQKQRVQDKKYPHLKKHWATWWRAYAKQRYEALWNDCDRWFNITQAYRSKESVAKTQAQERILSNARAYLSTIDSLAHVPATDRMIAIIDEAGTVPEFKIPALICLGSQAIIAIGDQKQLRPFTHSNTKVVDGYFQRVVRAINTPMLTIQYRMHEDICALVSRLFYDGKLTTAPEIQRANGGLFWIDYKDVEAETRHRGKISNAVEIEIILDKFMTKLDPNLAEGKTVAIITFYKQQFQLLMEAGERSGLVRKEDEMRELKKTTGRTPTRFKHPNFRIVTVDAVQGSEADVVVLSCVRCNPGGDLGFITDHNRLCVALSRARHRLVIVGSRKTLTKNSPTWRTVAENAKKMDEYVKCNI